MARTIKKQLEMSRDYATEYSFPESNWGNTIDLVYPYVNNGTSSEELKYSIRSFNELLHEDIRVWLVCDPKEVPEWVNPYEVKVIYHKRVKRKDMGTYRYVDSRVKTKLALEHRNMGDHFIFMNDDLFLMNPTATAYLGIPRYRRNLTTSFRKSRKPNSNYRKVQHRGYCYLKDNNYDIKDYTLHWPYVHSKNKFIELFDMLDMGEVPHNHESIYFNMFSSDKNIRLDSLEGLLRGSLEKVTHSRLLSAIILNSKNGDFGEIRELLKSRFIKKTKFEK